MSLFSLYGLFRVCCVSVVFVSYVLVRARVCVCVSFLLMSSALIVASVNKPPSVPPGTISEPHLQAMSHILQVSNLAGTPTQHCNTLLEEMRQLGASIKSVDRNSCLAIFPNSDAATVCRLKVSGTCAPLVVGPWTIRVNNNGPPLLPPRGPALSTDSSPQWSPAPPVAAFRQLDLKGS